MAAGRIEQTRRYREYEVRTALLPRSHHTAVDALERYIVQMGAPVRAIVGGDLPEFADVFLRNHPEGRWISREREDLTATDSVAGRS